MLVLNECDITYRSIRSATTLIRVHAVLDRISVASSILFVVHSNEAHFLFHFKFYHLSSNISIDSIPLFNCFFFAFFSDQNVLRYTVLWSPNRFKCLWAYVIWIGFMLLVLLKWICVRNCSICHSRTTYRFRHRLMIATDKF